MTRDPNQPMLGKYILVGKIPVLEPDLMRWAVWLEDNTQSRRVAETAVGNHSTVSTVFLGLDHQFGDGPPRLFETMVFSGPLDGYTDRYETWGKAEKGHNAMVKQVKAAIATQAEMMEKR